MRHSKYYLLIAGAIIALVLSACGRSASPADDALAGVWVTDDKSAYYSFNGDKTVQILGGVDGSYVRMDGTWERPAPDSVAILAKDSSSTDPKKYGVKIDGGKLTLTAADNSSQVLTKTTEALPPSESLIDVLKALDDSSVGSGAPTGK